VLEPGAFARRTPHTQQTWMLSVFRERVVWQRSHVIGGEIIEFVASAWGVPPRTRRTPPRTPGARGRSDGAA
jgi:hypothetical protein